MVVAIGRSKMPCIPKMALWGGLMIGVPSSDPNTPPFEMVKVPPSMSSTASVPFLALSANAAIDSSMSAKFIPSTFLNTGTTKPFGEATATEMST
uniref:Uncharacterized protein n=1 Tax=Anopheles atroparvus TaxID=41427 RepID=A0A182JI61_ANOAO